MDGLLISDPIEVRKLSIVSWIFINPWITSKIVIANAAITNKVEIRIGSFFQIQMVLNVPLSILQIDIPCFPVV